MSEVTPPARGTLFASNFAHLSEHDEQLLRLGVLAERYLPDDPNTALLKLRQLTELLAQHVAAKIGLFQSASRASTPPRAKTPKVAAGRPARSAKNRER